LPESNPIIPNFRPGDHLVGLLADTHGWLHPELQRIFAHVHHIIHAGDIGQPRCLQALRALAPTTAVRGNIDGEEHGDLPKWAEVRVGPCHLATLHIGGAPRRPTREARALVERLRPHVLVTGHNHVTFLDRIDTCLWINPGAAGNHGGHLQRLAAILHVHANGHLELHRVLLGRRGER